MGIHGSATCAISYDKAIGWLIGEAGKGLSAMFLMMNSARLHVGLQGLAHQEIATQNAERQAWDRQQGRSVAQAGTSAIAHHPAMRHILLRRRAMLEAQRVIAYRAALALDLSVHHQDAHVRQSEQALAAFMTPIIKAFLTQQGFQGASEALQVFGGYGYVRELGIEQTLRDARIAMIYEGTNEIQAIDLLQRKILGDGGATLKAWMSQAQEEVEQCRQTGLADVAQRLNAELEQARAALDHLMTRLLQSPELALHVADEVLQALSYTMMAWAHAASIRCALHSPTLAPPAAQAKLDVHRYGLQWLLPQSGVHWQRVCAGDLTLPQLQPTH